MSTYISEKSCHIIACIANSRIKSMRTGQPLTVPLDSSIRDHALQAGHTIKKIITSAKLPLYFN